jgi:hypothetical protein
MAGPSATSGAHGARTVCASSSSSRECSGRVGSSPGDQGKSLTTSPPFGKFSAISEIEEEEEGAISTPTKE